MRRLSAMLIALTMMFAIGCEPPVAEDSDGGDDSNTTMNKTIEGEGVQLVSLKLPAMTEVDA